MVLKLRFIISFLLLGGFAVKAQTQIGNDIIGSVTEDYSGDAISLSSDGKIVAIGAIWFDGKNGKNTGHVRIFENQSGNWVQLGNDIEGKKTNDLLGSSVSLSSDGKTVAIGTPQMDLTGHEKEEKAIVQVYRYTNSEWKQLGDDIIGEDFKGKHNGSISLSSDGNTIAIGTPFNTENTDCTGADPNTKCYAGLVRIYQYNNGTTTWEQLGNSIYGKKHTDNSGASISLSSDGEIIAIGATQSSSLEDYKYGYIHLYKYDKTNKVWNQLGEDIKGSSNEYTGNSISLTPNGKFIAVGYSGDKRKVRVFAFVNNKWHLLGNEIDGKDAKSGFSNSISLSSDGKTIAIGGEFDFNNKGKAYIYKHNIAIWEKSGDAILGQEDGDMFGDTVSLSADGTVLAIGAPNYAKKTGLVQIFDLKPKVLSTTKSTESTKGLFYPNPTTGILKIHKSELTSGKIILRNCIGAKLKTFNLTNSEEIDISDFSVGIYFVEAINNNKPLVKKIFKK